MFDWGLWVELTGRPNQNACKIISSHKLVWLNWMGHVAWQPVMGTLSWYPIISVKWLELIQRDWTAVDCIRCGTYTLQWLDKMVGYLCSSPCNGHQGDIPSYFYLLMPMMSIFVNIYLCVSILFKMSNEYNGRLRCNKVLSIRSWQCGMTAMVHNAILHS